MPSPQALLQEITRLLASWPGSATGNGDEQLRSYLLAIEDFDSMLDIEAGVNSLIKGTAPGVNPNFLPPPAALGAEVRRQNHLRAEAEDRARRLRPALPPPMVVHSPESRAKIKEMVDGVKARAAETAEHEAEARRKAQNWAKVNARFAPDMDEDAMTKRLGFTVGDQVGHEDAA
jgi:hypothetical protein